MTFANIGTLGTQPGQREGMPLLNGQMSGFQYEISGSPLRD